MITNGKEVKVKLIDFKTLTYQLLEDATAGDWFSIASEAQNYIETQIKEKTKEEIQSIKDQTRNEIFANDQEIKQMRFEIEQLKIKNTKLEEKAKTDQLDLDKKHTAEISKKDDEIKDLKNEVQEYKKNQNFEIDKIKMEKELEIKNKMEKEFEDKWEKQEKKLKENNEENNKKIIQELKENHKKIIQELKENHEKIIQESKKGYNEKIQKAEQENNELHAELNRYKEKNINSKEIGENLENWILERYKSVFPFGQENDETISFSLKKDTENLKQEGESSGTKADFIFTIYDKEGQISESVILEAKSESKEKPGRQKNNQFFKKLENDRVKKNARYAILVTELEPDQYITIDIAPNFPKIFICRPYFYLALLMILKSMILKEKKLVMQGKNLADKEKIINDFEKWKNDKIKKLAEKINKKSADAIASSRKIIDEATKIRDTLEETSNNLIWKLNTEIDKFNITEFAKKIERTEKISQEFV
ncbi:DUF2130 domain-containing protein [Mesomycoplasma flocculare]|uniref:DUF2130 domain-containing protein n=1 Tax=Mesomycoplasma flocculare ATCC 27399 TaxID=743971 RepID=A0A0A8E6U1_MESFC|nr:DUF2130 domain-containing protein [Mesomycoplasma flocculare]AJC49669.1 hypothetical protein MYF_00505 [Mesomycoplasma flocculare ATCC 27399]ENX51057.1 hypothetical protein MFC_00500 [Mesomycoplasma flocculare ATCC 27716]